MLARYGRPALVIALIVATALAFAVTERLKLKPTPITHTTVTKLFSPACRCRESKAFVLFRLRDGDRVTVSIVDSDNAEIRRLISGRSEPAGLLKAVWNGRGSSGALAPDGSYRVRVHLASERRTILLPNVIKLDTTPPVVSIVDVTPRTISPDRDGQFDGARVSYKLNERARPFLYADGKLVVEGKLRGKKIDWWGKIDGRVRLGSHELTLRARDLAGNMSKPTAPVVVRVRILELNPTRIDVKAGTRFGVSVSTDRKLVDWRFAGMSGRVSGSILHLRAPTLPGEYWLLVDSGRYSAGARIFVS